jgi:hypothetical protein
MQRAPLPLLALIAATLACAEPLELADWRIDVPPGTRIIELSTVPLEERDADAVKLVDDLVLCGDDTNGQALFYRPVDIVAAEDGRMFVADNGDQRVQRWSSLGRRAPRPRWQRVDEALRRTSAPPMVIRGGQSTTRELLQRSIEVLDYPEVHTAAGDADIAYLSPIHEYQVLAVSADGSPRMVDVYSPTDELLAAGLVDHIWTHARGDYVYGLRTNERDAPSCRSTTGAWPCSARASGR